MKSFLALGLLGVMLAGCGATGNSTDRALRNSPSFREGYEDGCGAATAEGSDLRDRPVGSPQLYKNDDVYRTGWSNGYQTCRRTNSATGTAPASGAIDLPGPGH